MSLEESISNLTGEESSVQTPQEKYKAKDTPSASVTFGLNAKTIEVGGVKCIEIMDKRGQVFAVPADDSNINRHEFRNLLEIPEREEGFFYQYVDGTRLNEYLTRGFKLVDREEIGLHKTTVDATGNPLTSSTTTSHQVGNLHLVKTPQIMADRWRRDEREAAEEAVSSIQIPRTLGKSLGEMGVEISSRKTDRVAGAPVVMPAAEFKTFE